MGFLDNIPGIQVYPRAAYPTWNRDETPWRDQDYDANFFVHAVKENGDKLGPRRKSLPIGVNGAFVRVDRSTMPLAQRAFGRWVADKTRELGIVDPVFVAIPNSDALVATADFRTARLVRAVAEAFGQGAHAFVGLRFEEYVPKDERDHRLTVQELVDNMRMIAPPQPGTLVLVDDVFTQGNHVTAAYRMMPEDRRPTVAFAAGRTCREPEADNWNLESELHFCW